MTASIKNETFSIENLIPFVRSKGGEVVSSGPYELSFRLSGKEYRLSVQNYPTIIFERILPYPDTRQYDFEIAAGKANGRESAVKVNVRRDEMAIHLCVAALDPSPEYFGNTFLEYLSALENTEDVIRSLYSSSAY